MPVGPVHYLSSQPFRALPRGRERHLRPAGSRYGASVALTEEKPNCEPALPQPEAEVS